MSDERSRSLLKCAYFTLIAVILFFVFLEAALWGASLILVRQPRVQETDIARGDWTVVFSGDSVTYGVSLPREASYPSQFSRLEVVRDLGIDVLNFSLPGKDFEYVYAEVGNYLGGEVDTRNLAVFVLAGFNNCAYLRTPVMTDVSISQNLHAAITRLRVYRLFAQLIFRVNDMSSERHRKEADILSQPLVRQCQVAIDEGVSRLQHMINNKGGRLFFLTYPNSLRPHPDAFDDGRLATPSVNAVIREVTRRRRAVLVDLVPCVQTEESLAPSEFFMPDGVHMTEEGYGGVARCLARVLPRLLEPLPDK